jgi:hypothetical protein
MGKETSYQEELPWMKDPPEEWSTRNDLTQLPPEECRMDVLSVDGAGRVAQSLWYPPKATTRGKVQSIYEYLYTWLGSGSTPTSSLWRFIREVARKPEQGITVRRPIFTGRLLLLLDAQASIGENILEGLVYETRKYDLAGFAEKTIITIGRLQEEIHAGGI